MDWFLDGSFDGHTFATRPSSQNINPYPNEDRVNFCFGLNIFNRSLTICVLDHPQNIRALPSIRIDLIYRIICDIGVEVELVFVADRIGLEEPAERRRVDAGPFGWLASQPLRTGF